MRIKGVSPTFWYGIDTATLNTLTLKGFFNQVEKEIIVPTLREKFFGLMDRKVVGF